MSQGAQTGTGTGTPGIADEPTGKGESKLDNSCLEILGKDAQDPADVEEEKREPSEDIDTKQSPGVRGNKNQSIMSSFRDFFLAAFSDSYAYQDHYGCCGSDTTYCTVPSGGKSMPPEQDCLRTQNSSRSYHDLEPSASRDSSRKRRKKPLAVAVGFNYANDMNGRPVVITRGTAGATASAGSVSNRRPIPAELHKGTSSRSSRHRPNSGGSSGGGSSSRKDSIASGRAHGINDVPGAKSHKAKAFAT